MIHISEVTKYEDVWKKWKWWINNILFLEFHKWIRDINYNEIP